MAFKPDAVRDLQRLTPAVSRRILTKLDAMQNDLAGDVKRLVKYRPGWRLRVGDWRILFEVVGTTIVVYNVVHRSSAYE